MEFFDFLKSKTEETVQYLDINGGMRLNKAEVDIMFIINNNQVIYVNNQADNLFVLDKDGDQKLEGRIVKFHFTNKLNESLDIFVAFDEQDSYTMFTLQGGIQERLNYVANAIFEYFYKENILHEFIMTEPIQVQFEYAFKLYKRKNDSFMVNNGQTQAYVVNKDSILSSGKNGDSVDSLKELFWK
jgi:hypothetical protein